MTDNHIDFETISANSLWEQLINQIHDCYEGDIELNDSKKLNEQGQYTLDINTNCLNNVINIKNSVGAKELLLKFDDKISWINSKIHSDDINLNLVFQAKGELYIGDLDSSHSLYTKLFGNKIILAGKVLSKTFMLQTEYFKCLKDALLSTTNFTEILIEEKGIIDCKIINDGKGILIKRVVDKNIFTNIAIGEEGLIASNTGLVKFDFGYNSKLEITARKLEKHEEKQSIAIASGKDIRIISGEIDINEGRAIIIYDDTDIAKTSKAAFKNEIIIYAHNFKVSGRVETQTGKIGIYFDESEEDFILLESGRIRGWEVYIDHNKGKGSIEGEIKAGKNVHVIFGELTLGEKNGKKSTILSQDEILIEVLNKSGEFNHYGVIGSQGKIGIKSLANYYNDGNSLLIAKEYLGVEVYQGKNLFINGMIYVEGKGYFGVQAHKDINFMPGSVIWLGNYEMSVNDYKIIKVKEGQNKLKTGTIRCYGCKFYRHGGEEIKSEMEMLVFEIIGVDVPTARNKLALTEGNEKSLAKLENTITKNTVITAEWHDSGLTKIDAGLIKEGNNAVLNFQGPTLLEMPTDIKYYLEGGGEKPQFYINAYGKLGSLMDGNDPLNIEKKFLEDGKDHFIKQSALGFEKRLMLAGSGIYEIDLIAVIRNEGLKDGWIWKKQDITCKEDCEFIIEGKNGINFKPIVYFTAKANKEIREYIKFPFDVCAFLENLGFNEVGEHLIIGDGQYLYKLVNDVAYKEIGLFIGGQEILLNILASNALWEFTKNPLLEVGKELSQDLRIESSQNS